MSWCAARPPAARPWSFGRAQLNLAEVTFENGNVQLADFEDRTHPSGVYGLLDFADGRHVKTVRLLARSRTDETTLTVYVKG